MKNFIINSRVQIQSEVGGKPVEGAIRRFYRDVEMTVLKSDEPGGTILLRKQDMEPEQYRICVAESDELVIWAGDDLGFIYGLLYLSETYLGVPPFWFWNDVSFDPVERVEITEAEFLSVPYPVAYRGWFVNDEVLISHWDAGRDKEYPWEMVFEALLRLGGNLVIPGTDLNSKIYAPLASDMGLWITHHHAEPLGAEMFSRVYPDKTPSYAEYPELFEKLWREGILRQKDQKIIWNIGFRGQGDRPFWADDPRYDTPKKRGKLISSIMKQQYDLVKSMVEQPVFCTNLYGETMELYQDGMLTLPDDVIMIWADNGYGKMVSRRQGNNNPRVPALPPESLKSKNHGVYYHASFYDLQAANHMTMIPNSMEFLGSELNGAYESGIRKLWLINCSNVKPHVYPLDFISALWRDRSVTAEGHRREYIRTYYQGNSEQNSGMADCFAAYFDCTLPYGEREDERAGEQFYNYVTRGLIHGWMKDGGNAPCGNLRWFSDSEDFSWQIADYRNVCEAGIGGFEALEKRCEEIAGDAGSLWADSLLLQVKLHTFCIRGAILFCRAYEEYRRGSYMESFYLTGQAADWYEAADQAQRSREHGKWKGFYENDCLTDLKQTAYCLRRLMGYIRNIGDGPHFYEWQREATYSEEDKRVVLITNMENHMTDEELYHAIGEEYEKAGDVEKKD